VTAFELARALAEHIGTEKTTARQLLDLHLPAAERYLQEHRTKQPTNCLGDVLVHYADKLGVTVFKARRSQRDLKRGAAIVTDSTLRANGRAFSRSGAVASPA
jgi:hypothetical protein